MRPRDVGSSPIPPFWRVLAYAPWLVVFVALEWLVPRFEPILRRLDEKGELFALTHAVCALTRFNRAWHGLPCRFGLLVVIAVSEAALLCFRPRRRGRLLSRLWLIAVGLVGLGTQCVLVVALIFPAPRMAPSFGRSPAERHLTVGPAPPRPGTPRPPAPGRGR